MSLPKYEVAMYFPEREINQRRDVIKVEGHLECKQVASLIFTDDRDRIIRAFAPGSWVNVKIIE